MSGKRYFDEETFEHDVSQMKNKAEPELLIFHQPDNFKEYFVKMIPHMRYTMYNTLKRKDPDNSYADEICHMYDYFTYIGTHGLPRWQTYDYSVIGKKDWSYFKFFIMHVKFQCKSMNSDRVAEGYYEANIYQYDESGNKVVLRDENNKPIKQRFYIGSLTDSNKNSIDYVGQQALDRLELQNGPTIQEAAESKNLIVEIRKYALNAHPYDDSKKTYDANIGQIIADMLDGHDIDYVMNKYHLAKPTLTKWIQAMHKELKDKNYL